LLNPWDRELLKDGQFIFHPEYANSLDKQGLKPDASMLIPAPIIPPEKT
jgi:hypothetical protein